MSASSSSSSASSSTAVSPKPKPESEPISSPKVILRRTARISTGGKVPHKQLAAPFGQQPVPAPAPEPLPIPRRSQVEPWWNHSSATSSGDSDPEDDSKDDSDPEDDPEDDPDNEFGFIHKKKRLRRYFSSDLADESDEEELGDQDRKSIDDADPDSLQNLIDGRDYDIASPDGDDSNF